MRIYALLTNRHYTIMSLFKSLTGLAKATVQLVKEDKQFRKELAISIATAPIIAGKEFFDTMDNATNATKTYDTVLTKASERYIAEEIYNGNFTDYTVTK